MRVLFFLLGRHKYYRIYVKNSNSQEGKISNRQGGFCSISTNPLTYTKDGGVKYRV